MKKKIEARILEELKDRVFQMDIDIKKRHEEKELSQATKEALTEMTELPLKEINILEKEVRNEILLRRKRNFKRLWIYGIIFVIMASALYFFGVPYQYNDKLVFEESFDNNDNKWPIYSDYSYDRYFENGSYIFTSNRPDSIYEDEISLTMPIFFTVEVKTSWLGGQFDPYGIRLHLSHGHSSYLFQLHPKNKTNIKRSYDRYNPKWIIHTEDSVNNKHEHIQRITVKPYPWPGGNASRNGRFKYYVNDEIVINRIYTDLTSTGNPDYPQPRLTFFVSGKQKISFDHLKIRDDRTGRILFEGNFEEIQDRLHPKMLFNNFSYIYNGEYIFKTNDKDKCYRAVLQKKFKKHSKIKLTGTWLKGEDYYYGMILQNDQNTYYAFELKSCGTACFIKRIDGEDEIFIDNIQTNLVDTNEDSFEITVFLKGEKLEYYVNDQLVFEDKYDISLNAFGLRVCGNQEVSFDNIQIWE